MWTMAPVNPRCQMFQMSTLMTLVILAISMRMLTTMAMGMASRPIVVAQAIGAEPGQPTSMTVRVRPKRSAMDCAAGPIVSVSRLMTMLMPTPTVRPAQTDLPMPWRSRRPSTMTMSGSMTEGPRSMIACKNCMRVSLR